MSFEKKISQEFYIQPRDHAWNKDTQLHKKVYHFYIIQEIMIWKHTGSDIKINNSMIEKLRFRKKSFECRSLLLNSKHRVNFKSFQ